MMSKSHFHQKSVIAAFCSQLHNYSCSCPARFRIGYASCYFFAFFVTENVQTETEIEQLKRENETLKRENAELKETNSKLNSAIQQLFDTRQQLLNVQDRLTVTEQVTAVTQRRQLVQEGFHENLPPRSVYEKLRFDPAQEHVYAKLQTHLGCIIFDLSRIYSCEKSLLLRYIIFLSCTYFSDFG